MVLRTAIIGGGAAGLTSLYELLHTSADGKSTVYSGELPTDPAFEPVLFERNAQVGGVWNASLNVSDPPLPNNADNYNDPFGIQPQSLIPEFIHNLTRNSSLKTESYNHSPVYHYLYTNIPEKFMQFSYSPEPVTKNPHIEPFLYHDQVKGYLQNFAEKHKLFKYINFNTTVEKVTADKQGLNIITKTVLEDGRELWKESQFDKLIIASGHYNVPYYPLVPGFKEYIKKYPDVILHSKAYRSSDQFKGKSVLIVGSSISSIDIIQYIYPVVKELYISKKSDSLYEWINNAIAACEINVKPVLKRYNLDGSVEFEDGTKLESIDKIILSTGYHYHYPFLDDSLFHQTADSIFPSSNTKVDDLYLHTFHISNPNIAFVGIAQTPTVFSSLESAAAAIAGVWAEQSAQKLPPKAKQIEWIEKRVKESGNNKSFQCYAVTQAREWFIDPLNELSAPNRNHPFEVLGDPVKPILDGLEITEKLFYKVKTGEIQFPVTT